MKPGTEYVRLTARDYRIRFTDGDVSVMYESSVDPASFLGDAGTAVLGGGVGASSGAGTSDRSEASGAAGADR